MSLILNYVLSIVALGVVFFTSSNFSPIVFNFFEANSEKDLIIVFFVISCLFALNFITYYVARATRFPSFVFAIFFGIVGKPLLAPIIENKEILIILVNIGAILILFGGGLETPFHNFKKLFWKINSISFIGLLITAFLFSQTVIALNSFFGLNVSMVCAALLGAVLASTDPAAIIPILKNLRFKNRDTKDLIISESAVTDVVGTLITSVFLVLIAAGVSFDSINNWYQNIFTSASAILLGKELFFGELLGFTGFLALKTLHKFKDRHKYESEVDSALFIAIPIFIFTIALSFHGSGFLAAFVAGLIFHVSEQLKETEHFFNQVIEGFLKPTIFILLGALVNLESLWNYLGIGLMAALIFMFIIRPIAVFISLGGFSFFGSSRFSFKELLFISFVRETGAIPAVLMVMISSLNIAGIEGLVEIGMWSILATLIIEPLLTNKFANFLQVAEIIEETKNIDIGNDPQVILVTRGFSFLDRLSTVAEWAFIHNVKKVLVMLCPEDRYSDQLIQDVRMAAENKFKELNNKEDRVFNFSFVSYDGLLEDNIKKLSSQSNNITAIFVGQKMLDYKLSQIKNLKFPFYFMD